MERLRTELRFAGVLNTSIPRGNLARKTASVAKPSAQEEPVPPVEEDEKPSSAKPFDPFSIHTTNIYKKDGADGLLAALSAISDTAQLKSMVTAQRIPVAGVDEMTDADTLRTSIVAAVADRIADRKAAAS